MLPNLSQSLPSYSCISHQRSQLLLYLSSEIPVTLNAARNARQYSWLVLCLWRIRRWIVLKWLLCLRSRTSICGWQHLCGFGFLDDISVELLSQDRSVCCIQCCVPLSFSEYYISGVVNCLGHRVVYVGTGFGPVAFVAFGLRLGHEAGGWRPPSVSPAPTSLPCPHQPRLPPCWGVELALAVMPGIGLQMWYSASPSMLSPFPYICLSFSLSLLSRQSLLYESQFNISIRTRLISTGYEPFAFSSLESTSISFIISEALPAIEVSYFDFVLLEPTTSRSIRIEAYY